MQQQAAGGRPGPSPRPVPVKPPSSKEPTGGTAFVERVLGIAKSTAFLEAHLLCHKRFISPRHLASGLLRMLSSALKARDSASAQNVLVVLNAWLAMKNFTASLEKEKRLEKYLHKALGQQDEKIAEEASRVYLSLLRALTSRRLRRAAQPAITTRPGPAAYRLWSNTREDIATMLCRVHWEMFSRIPIGEFLSLARGNKGPQTAALRMFVERCSRLSEWVASCILAQAELHAQARLYGFFLYIAQLCAQAGNFDVCSAVIAGCTMHEVDRLKRLWKVPEKVDLLFRYTRANVDSSANFKAYRGLLAQRAKNSSQPFLPLIACHLRDLTLIEEGNPNRLADGTINESKLNQLHTTLSIILLAQHRNAYKPPPLPPERAVSLRHHVTMLRSRGKVWLEERSRHFRPSQNVNGSDSDSTVSASQHGDSGSVALQGSSDLSSQQSHDSDLVDAVEDSELTH